MKKANSFSIDEKHNYIEGNDITLLRQAQVYMVVAPAATVAVIYLVNKLRRDVFMSNHFYYSIKNLTTKF